MISSKSGYRHVDVSKIPVDGNIMPLRETNSNGPRVLKAVDMAFLEEGFDERNNVYGAGYSWVRFDGTSWMTYYGVPSPVLPLVKENKKTFNNIASMFCVRTAAAHTSGGGYMTYLNPDKAISIVAKMKLYDFAIGTSGDALEDELIRLTGLRQAFSPLNSANKDDAYVKRLDLDRTRMRKAFADLKRLQYVIVPMKLKADKSKVRMTSVKGYDSTPPEGQSGEMYDDSYTRDIKLTVTPYATRFGGGGNIAVSFPDIGCYCVCSLMAENSTTHTLYMSEKGNTDTADDHEGVICCVSEVNVWAEDNLVMEPVNDIGGWNPGANDMKKTVLVFRAWNRVSGEDGDGSNPPVMESTYWMRAYSSVGTRIKKKWIDTDACQEMLTDSGYRTTVDSHPDPAHTESCGVDLMGVYVIAKPQFNTDLKDVNCPTG